MKTRIFMTLLILLIPIFGFCQNEFVHGYNPGIDSLESAVISELGGDQLYPSAAAITTVVSDSSVDSIGGVGARTVTVYGVNSTYQQIREVSILTGTKIDTLSAQFLFIDKMEITTYGDSARAIGNIYGKIAAKKTCMIVKDGTYSKSTIWVSPSRLYSSNASILYSTMPYWFGSAGKNTDTTIDFELQVRAVGTTTWVLKDKRTLSTLGVTTSEFNRNLKLMPGDMVRLITESNKDDSCVYGGYYLEYKLK